MKAGLVAPLYLSVSWVLTVSYQLFTDTAVRTISTGVGSFWPNAGGWITSNIQTLVFIYAFTWIFVLSSVIPSVILGKERRVLTQYLVVLALSLIAFFMPDLLLGVAGINVGQIFSMTTFLENPALAGFYLALPYLFMLGLDIRGRFLAKQKQEMELTVGYFSLTAARVREKEKPTKHYYDKD
jgi:hypothetical protein